VSREGKTTPESDGRTWRIEWMHDGAPIGYNLVSDTPLDVARRCRDETPGSELVAISRQGDREVLA
jgi:hypothetical protein